VLDTWFSSWLWPISVFDPTVFGDANNKGNKDLNYYYPTNDLITAPEILFFWVARMAIAGYEYRKQPPFKNVYLTGIVRDKQGRKMSKSLGNSPDPLDLIKNFGADGVRTGMLFSSPAGNDLLFDEKLVEQGRNFANKIWNAFRLVKGLNVENKLTSIENKVATEWFEAEINQSLILLKANFEKFKISDALQSLYRLVWGDYCSWYLEIIKPEFGNTIDQVTYNKTIEYFETLLKLLHPFMPFITEELWHELRSRKDGDSIMISSWPKPTENYSDLVGASASAFAIITTIRNTRNSNGISPKEQLSIKVKLTHGIPEERFLPIIKKLANVNLIEITEVEATNPFIEFEIIHGDKFDKEKEIERITKEIEYQKGFLVMVDKKLSNEKFVNSAPPQVIEMERKKKADAEAKIKSLEESFKNL
jgi:valyl-tRNA synthetase